jgi:hypothetical protein
MIPDEIEAIFHEQAEKLWKQWWEERSEHPSVLRLVFDLPLQPGRRIVVESHSQQYMECTPNDENFLKWSPLLIDETLTPSTCEKLAIVLQTIKACQGLNAHEALAFLTFLHVIHIDMQRAGAGNTSILWTDRWAQYDAHNHNSQTASPQAGIVHPAAWTLEQMLDFWYTCGGKFFRGIPAPDEKTVGRWCYLRIPPKWLTNDVLEEVNRHLSRLGEPVEPAQIPVFVEPNLQPMVEHLMRFGQEARQQGMPILFNLASTSTEHQSNLIHTVGRRRSRKNPRMSCACPQTDAR